MTLRRALLACIAASMPGLALACGACLEDKIAATYDHGVVTAAVARGERMVFGAIDGAIDARRVSERIRAIAPKIGGVHKETVRVSASPAAFSFALDGRVTPQSLVAELERRLAVAGVHLSVVRVQ